MNFLLITDDSNRNRLGNALKEDLLTRLTNNGFNCRHLGIKTENLHECMGCFNCWTKTPGKCIIPDLGNQFCGLYMESDCVLLLSPVKFGCYSTTIKMAMERISPINLPFLSRFHHRTRHKARYGKYPHLLVIGYGDDITKAEENTFKYLANANAVNFQRESAEVFVCRHKDDISSIHEALENISRSGVK